MVGRADNKEDGRNPQSIDVAYDEENLKWQIASLRVTITADWIALASRQTFSPERRKAIRDHLDMSTCALRTAAEQLQACLSAQREARRQGIVIDLDKLAEQIIPPLASPAANSPEL
jgi:hypothetical protein